MSSSTINLNQWNFISCVYDGVNNIMYLYHDGQLISQNSISNGGQLMMGTNKVRIGAHNNGYDFLAGKMDNVQIWNTAQNQSEIQSYMSCPPTGNETDLVGYWNFNEGSGAVVNDLSSNGNNGAINGASWSNETPNQTCNNCTAVDTILVSLNTLPTVTVNDATICAGDPAATFTATSSTATAWLWSGNGTGTNGTTTGTTAGAYSVVVTDANGCQSASASGNLTVNALPTVVAGADQAVCNGGAVTLSASGASTYGWDNGVTDATAFIPTATATYTVTGTDANGCIGADQVDITVNTLPIVLAGADQAVCDGGSVTLSASGASTYAWDNSVTNGTTFTPTATGTYTVTGTDANGCIALDSVNVTVNSNYYNIINISLCTGDSILAGGAYQTLSGTFYDSLSSMAGCDSVIETVLTVSSQITVNLPLSVCYGDSALINGNYELASGTFYDTATSVLGCDSITITNFTVDSLITNSIIASICQGDSLLVGGEFQTTPGNYVDTLSSANGCDSILTTTLIVNPIVTNNLTASICQGDSLLVGGSYQTVAGDYVDSLSTTLGCDSILTTTLIVNPVATNSVTAIICQGDSMMLGGAYQQ